MGNALARTDTKAINGILCRLRDLSEERNRLLGQLRTALAHHRAVADACVAVLEGRTKCPTDFLFPEDEVG